MGAFTSDQVQNVANPFYDQGMKDSFLGWLRGHVTASSNGGYDMFGATMFEPNSEQGQHAAQLMVQPNDNLKKAWNAWQPWDAGAQYSANYITNGAGADPTVSGLLNNVQQYGTTGGYGGQLMHNMAQNGGAGDYTTGLMHNMAQSGGTGGPGNNAMSLAMQYGAPSQQAGQYASNLAQYGIASQGSGTPLANRAYGQQTAAMNYLQPFMQGQGRQYGNPIQYAAPTLPGVQQMGAYQAPSIQR